MTYQINDIVRVAKGASRRFKPYTGVIIAQMGSGSVHLVSPIEGRSPHNPQWVSSDRITHN